HSVNVRFFLTLRLPPPTPLFAYTTLFRSHLTEDGGQRDAQHHARQSSHHGQQERFDEELGLNLPGSRADGLFETDLHRALGNRGDRKSTRLNSSHVSTSYAVSCMKK